MARSKGRSGRPWLRCAEQVKAWVRDLDQPCWICGRAIDLEMPARHRASFSVDHVIPLDDDGPARDMDNLRPAHYGCNSSRGNKTRAKKRQPIGNKGKRAAPRRYSPLPRLVVEPATSRNW